MKPERDRIRKKLDSIRRLTWKSDPFDVRYYLVTQVKKITNKLVLDVGGGVGIICSEMDKSNFRIVTDLSFDKLLKCITKTDSNLNPICASFTHLPFKENFFDIVINSHVIELAKQIDVTESRQKNENNQYPTVIKLLSEINRVLKRKGKIYLTTPNNAYHHANKLSYDELKQSIEHFFENNQIFFFNTYKKFSKNRKLDLANVLPRFKAKFIDPDKIIASLIKEKNEDKYSRYFYCTANKK